MRKYFKGKLLKNGKPIDDNVEGSIILEEVSEYATFFDVAGGLKTSKPIPATMEALLVDDNHDNPPQFELVFDKPIIEGRKETSRLPIRFTYIDREGKRFASFEAGESRRR